MTLEMAAAKGFRPGHTRTYPMELGMADLSHDPALAAKIMKKRQDEMKRRAALMDRTKRKCGVDVLFLSQQLAEKQAVAEIEKQEEALHAHSLLVQQHVQDSIENFQSQIVRDRQKAVLDYSIVNLRREQRREYELSDPHQVKKATLPDYDDPSLGPSSMLKFKSDCPDETKQKRATQAQWLAAQLQAKKDKEDAQKQADYTWALKGTIAAQVKQEAEEAAEEEARAARLELAADNAELAAAHRARRQEQLDKDSTLKLRHVNAVCNDDKGDKGAEWKLGPHAKYFKAEYSEVLAEHVKETFEINERQVHEKRQAAQTAAAIQKGQNMTGMLAFLNYVEAEKERMQKDRERATLDENLRMAAARRKREAEERHADKYFKWED